MTEVRDGFPDGRAWQRWLGAPDSRRPVWASSLAVAVFQIVGTNFAAHDQPGRASLDAFARLLLLIGPALLVVRHRYPRVTVFGTSAVAMVYFAAGYPYGPVFISVAVACFAAIVTGHRWAAWSAVGMLWAGHVLVAFWLFHWLPPADDTPPPWIQELGVAAWVVAIIAASELVRLRREQMIRERAEREEAEKRRADEERLRIARELHDVLAHSISVINVQAGVGLALLDQDPEQARTALTTIRAASKEALDEVRQVLDTLRTPGDAPRSPAPGLDRLEELTDQAYGAGLAVEVRVEGERTALPAGADLAAFRIVQEALTNVVRHSSSRTAEVLLRYARREVVVRIDDTGPAAQGGESGGGRGLVGMRERAAALGGVVEAGRRPDGGFRVLARIPFASPATVSEAHGRAPDKEAP
ncbi:sensor histidine kinase [Streptomyces sp. NPDC051776]|uniref:sensor histidine kinase n=1 Tax=Streptomyces sp. NPDC051776 TaxID=3155414 RepID=UPI003427AB00